jgi:hypothetical protein
VLVHINFFLLKYFSHLRALRESKVPFGTWGICNIISESQKTTVSHEKPLYRGVGRRRTLVMGTILSHDPMAMGTILSHDPMAMGTILSHDPMAMGAVKVTPCRRHP